MTGRVFISHASRDAALAHDLVAALEAGGVACWISGRAILLPERVESGTEITEQRSEHGDSSR